MHTLARVPVGQENFYYASQTAFWIFYRVRRSLLDEQLGDVLARLGLAPASFDEPEHAFLNLCPMAYTAVFGAQDTKANRPGMGGISELEFNVLSFPVSKRHLLPDISFADYLLGREQQKLVGDYRLAVVCNHMGAVFGGREKYGEHKFLGDIDYRFATFNDNATTPTPFFFDFDAYQPGGAGEPEQLMFRLRASVGSSRSVVADFSPVMVYGAMPSEAGPGVRQQTLGSRRNHLGLFRAFLPEPGHDGLATLQYGPCRDARPLHDSRGTLLPDSPHWPARMRERMQRLLTDAELCGFLLFQSPPVETEPLPFIVDPGAA